METFIKEDKQVTKDNIIDVVRKMLNETVIVYNKLIYRICEIEFYLLSDDHPDKYTHGNDDQKEYGKWYFLSKWII
jgi:hypothetical protein